MKRRRLEPTRLVRLTVAVCLIAALAGAGEKSGPSKPGSRTVRKIEGWTVRVDDRLLQTPNVELGSRALKSLEARLADISAVVRPDRLEKLRAVTIVLDLSHGKLTCAQYHPDADWLTENGYAADLVHCVHLPRAAELLEPRQINVQPWYVLHELAHAYHDQVLGFDDKRIREAYQKYKKSGHGDSALLITGERVRHYGLTNEKEFFAEMTESYFGTNDFFPFNRAELMTAEPEIYKLLLDIWGPVQTEPPAIVRQLRVSNKSRGAGVSPASPAAGTAAPLSPASPAAGMTTPLKSGTGATLLWYRQPAAKWDETLPVGNGRLGAEVYGGTEDERIVLNEQTVWSGGPYDPTRSGGPEALPEIRRLVLAGKYFQAEELFGKTMLGKPADQMKYQPLGKLSIHFPGHAAATDYRRELDLDTAIASVTYRVGDTRFRREVFVSPVDQVIVVRLSADKRHAINCTVKLDGIGTKSDGAYYFVSGLGPTEIALAGKTCNMAGIKGRVKYAAMTEILVEGGSATQWLDSRIVTAADAVTLRTVAATNFKRYDDISANEFDRVKEYARRLKGKSFAQLRADHIAAHQKLFRRVRLNLPETEASARPTDERLRQYNPKTDPQLAALMFQYGRYLLIGSSRPGCQPANLQGIWNEDRDPAWESKFTTNINLEMNYWPAEVANLPECVEPLVEMVRDLSETGGKVAKREYGAPGWVFHQNTDQWRAAAPMDGSTWGTFSIGGAWLCTHLWEHYRYNGDKDYLRRVYPLLKGSAEFFLATLIEYPRHGAPPGSLVTCPSTSPENFPACPGNHPFHDNVINWDAPGTTICAGSTIDMSVLRDLFDACGEAAGILDVDRDFRARVKRARQRLAPLQIGKRGNLQEWIEDWGDLEKQHRHISHLYALYPSNQISPAATPALAKAAAVSLNERSDRGTGFGMAWKAACWARLLDSEHANRCLANLVALQTCPNLFSKCFKAPQVDGALGATAAIAEMLMQSQSGEIGLLPALPAAWSKGEFSGLRARGGFEVDAAWSDGRLTSAAVRSTLGGPCRLRANCPLTVKQGPRDVNVQRDAGYAITFETVSGGTYSIRAVSK